MSSSVVGPSPGAGRSETFAIRWIGVCAGESAKAQPLDRPSPSSSRDSPVELVADEHAVADEVERLRLDSLVVVADRRQTVLARCGRR